MADDTAARRGGSYLPVPPPGWFYSVSLNGPGGEEVSVLPDVDNGAPRTAHSPHAVLTRGTARTGLRTADGLTAAVKAAVEVARALHALDTAMGAPTPSPGGGPWPGLPPVQSGYGLVNQSES